MVLNKRTRWLRNFTFLCVSVSVYGFRLAYIFSYIYTQAASTPSQSVLYVRIINFAFCIYFGRLCVSFSTRTAISWIGSWEKFSGRKFYVQTENTVCAHSVYCGGQHKRKNLPSQSVENGPLLGLPHTLNSAHTLQTHKFFQLAITFPLYKLTAYFSLKKFAVNAFLFTGKFSLSEPLWTQTTNFQQVTGFFAAAN